MGKKLKFGFNLTPENKKWIICGLIVLAVIIILLMICKSTKKQLPSEGYIFGLSDEEKCNKNSKGALTQHCTKLLDKQFVMAKEVLRNKAEEDKWKKDFMRLCDHPKTLEDLCKQKETRSLLKQLVENSKILLDESKNFNSQASALKEKLKKEYDSSTLNQVYKIFGL